MAELLSICIPTYQRPRHLDTLLSKLAKQLEGLEPNLVKIYISDNCSDDETPTIVENHKSKLPIIYNRNSENVGMMLNFVKVIEIAQGDFIWLFGDDDEFQNDKAIEMIVNVLKKHNPHLLILHEPNYSKLKVDKFFINVKEFFEYFTKFNPSLFWTQTWITANIIKRESFRLEYAVSNINTFYMHMYGIMKGMKETNGSVYVLTEQLVKPCEEMGYREDNFPNLKEKWIEYFNFLANTFEQPKLIKYAKKWEKSYKDTLIPFFRYFNPNTYIFFAKRHLFNNK